MDASISFRAELTRKSIHLLALVLPIGMTILERPVALGLLGGLTVVALACEVARTFFPAANRFFVETIGWMMRVEEKPPPGRFYVTGATWVVLAALLLLVCFPGRLAGMTLAVFMIGDAAAALVGRRFGRHAWGSTGKTKEGTAAFIGAGMAASLLFPQSALWIGPAAAVFAGVLELLPGPLNDNIQVPLLTALAVAAAETYLLGQPIPLFPGLL